MAAGAAFGIAGAHAGGAASRALGGVRQWGAAAAAAAGIAVWLWPTLLAPPISAQIHGVALAPGHALYTFTTFKLRFAPMAHQAVPLPLLGQRHFFLAPANMFLAQQ